MAVSGELHVLDPPACLPGLPYPQPRDEAIRFRAEVMEPGESFDQTGFELPPAPLEDPTQPDLFGDDFSQSDAADGEPVFRRPPCPRPPRVRSCFLCLRRPVFWSAGVAQPFPPDDGVQPDAPE